MPSDYFQSYVAVLRRIGQIEAELQREQQSIEAQARHAAERAYPGFSVPPAQATQQPDAPIPGEQPLTLGEMPLGKRFRGN